MMKLLSRLTDRVVFMGKRQASLTKRVCQLEGEVRFLMEVVKAFQDRITELEEK